jgi:DNA-binding response OmpR family regulator
MTDPAATTASAFPAAPPQTILVIDDDLAMRTILGFTLEAMGYLVLSARDGEAGLETARDHPEIRLVILDVVMSGSSGKELADRLQIDLPQVAILFCSGHPPQSMSLHGIDVKSDHFMQKPCRSPELQRKVEELLALP